MPNSPAENSTGVTTFTIKANGKAIESTIGIIAIDIHFQINKVAYAELTIDDGNVAKQTFAVSEGDTFKPGTKININAGYSSKEESIFEGVIISHAIKISADNQSTLNITCKDLAVAMTVARNSQSFLKQSDSDIISKIIAKYSKVKSEKVESISEKHDELVQFNCSDWDFLLTRAEANGLVVSNQNNSISVVKPNTSTSPALVVTYGVDLFSVSAEVDARNQLSKVSAVAWDPSNQKIQKGQAKSESITGQGDFSDSELAKVLGIKDYRLQTSGNLTTGMLESWSKGQRIKSMLSKTRGTVTFQGNAQAKINSLIKLAGVGKRFNGSHYVGGVRHQIKHGQWITEVELGLSPLWSTEHRDLGAPPAGGWLPPVDGLQIGVVKKLNEDPESQHRIQVEIPALGNENNLVWARLASYYATKKSGNFFIPEMGDEVVVGYINQDASQPIVLGSLYSSKHTSPYNFTAENHIKAIVSKNQLKIEFNEEDKVITIVTPGKNSITISDKGKSITLADQNKNTITMNDSGIALDSPKDIKISAKGSINMKSTNKTNIKAQADLSMEGMNLNAKAQIGLTAKGSASAEISASGMTTVKGGLVKIN